MSGCVHMRLSVLGTYRLGLARGAALLVLGGLTAGCSSSVSRFTDGLVTASTTPNQQQIVNRSQPDLVAPAREETYSISDARSAAPRTNPVQRTSLPPVAGTTQSNEPFRRASAPVEQDDMPVATARQSAIEPLSRAEERAAGVEKAAVERKDPAGWSSAGGTQITAKEGETVFNLSRRYGVPADVLMKVNGIDESGALNPGQKVRIPIYVYSDRAPVSAPDNNPKVAKAKSSRGEQELTVPASTGASKQAAAQKADNGIYVVESGDSLLGIARDNGTTMAAIREANGMQDNNLRIGQKLRIPSSGSVVAMPAKPKAAAEQSASIEPVSKKDAAKPKTLDETRTASTEPVKKKELAAARSEQEEAPKKVAAVQPTKAVSEVESEDSSAAPSATGIGKMRWPVKGRVVAGYGKGGGNAKDGIDIQVPEGTPVKAAENGVVIYAGNGLKDFGNTVLVRHDNGLVTVYGNASELNVKRGQKVKRGEQIATSGMSGAAESPKLHFEVRKDAAPVDPSTYLE